jgi:hypothetical protein
LFLSSCQAKQTSQTDIVETNTLSYETQKENYIDIPTQITTNSNEKTTENDTNTSSQKTTEFLFATSSTSNDTKESDNSDLGTLLLQTDFDGDGNDESIYHNHNKEILIIEINSIHFNFPVVKNLYYFETNDQNTKQYGFGYFAGKEECLVGVQVDLTGGFLEENWTWGTDMTEHYDYRRIWYSIFNSHATRQEFNSALSDIKRFISDTYYTDFIKEYELFDFSEDDELCEIEVNNNKIQFFNDKTNEVYMANDKFMLKSFIPEIICIYSRKRLYADERNNLTYDDYEYLIKLQKENGDIQLIYLGTADENFISPYSFYNEIVDDNKLDEQGWLLVDKMTNIKSTLTEETSKTTSIITITEPTIDNYNAADYNPLYIDFNQDGIDEVVYRIPTNSIYNRVCIKINGIDYLFPDIDRIYSFNAGKHWSLAYSFTYNGVLGEEERFIGAWGDIDGYGNSYQRFSGYNDTCVIYKSANDKDFKEGFNNNNLLDVYKSYGWECNEFVLDFYDVSKYLGLISIENNILDIIVEQMDIENTKFNIKLSNERNYYYVTYMPDEMYLYKRKRLLNENYRKINNANLVEKDEFMILTKYSDEKMRVVDGIFLGTEDESYIGQLYKYSYDVEKDMYYYCDIEDCITADEFNRQWNIVGNQNIDDRWELVREVYIVE